MQPNAIPFIPHGIPPNTYSDNPNSPQYSLNGHQGYNNYGVPGNGYRGNGSNGGRGSGSWGRKAKHDGRMNNSGEFNHGGNPLGNPYHGYVQSLAEVESPDYPRYPVGVALPLTPQIVSGSAAAGTFVPPMLAPPPRASSFGGNGTGMGAGPGAPFFNGNLQVSLPNHNHFCCDDAAMISRAASYGRTPSPQQYAPDLRMQAPPRLGPVLSNFYRSASKHVTEAMTMVPGSTSLTRLSAMDEELPTSLHTISTDLFPGVGPIISPRPKKDIAANDNKKQNPYAQLTNYNTLQHLAALSATTRENMMAPLEAARKKHIQEQDQISEKRSEALTTLGEAIREEQEHEEKARMYQDYVADSLAKCARRGNSEKKDEYLRFAASDMRKAKVHSEKAAEHCQVVGRCREQLDNLNQESVKASQAYYLSLHEEILSALRDATAPSEKDMVPHANEMEYSEKAVDEKEQNEAKVVEITEKPDHTVIDKAEETNVDTKKVNIGASANETKKTDNTSKKASRKPPVADVDTKKANQLFKARARVKSTNNQQASVASPVNGQHTATTEKQRRKHKNKRWPRKASPDSLSSSITFKVDTSKNTEIEIGKDTKAVVDKDTKVQDDKV